MRKKFHLSSGEVLAFHWKPHGPQVIEKTCNLSKGVDDSQGQGMWKKGTDRKNDAAATREETIIRWSIHEDVCQGNTGQFNRTEEEGWTKKCSEKIRKAQFIHLFAVSSQQSAVNRKQTEKRCKKILTIREKSWWSHNTDGDADKEEEEDGDGDGGDDDDADEEEDEDEDDEDSTNGWRGEWWEWCFPSTPDTRILELHGQQHSCWDAKRATYHLCE